MNANPPESREQRHEITIGAPPEAVWRAISDGAELTRWYAEEASVTPGEGGSVTVSWGGDMADTSEIEVWEEPRRLRVVSPPTEGFPPGSGPVVQEWSVEGRGGSTVLRLVFSGIPQGADWDGFYDGTNNGWVMFFRTLRHYLERHPGKPRRSEILSGDPGQDAEAVWARVTAALGLRDGRYETTLPTGERLSGTLLLERTGHVLLATVEQLDDGLFTLELAPGSLWANLAAYGPVDLEPLNKTWRDWLASLTIQPDRTA